MLPFELMIFLIRIGNEFNDKVIITGEIDDTTVVVCNYRSQKNQCFQSVKIKMLMCV